MSITYSGLPVTYDDTQNNGPGAPVPLMLIGMCCLQFRYAVFLTVITFNVS